MIRRKNDRTRAAMITAWLDGDEAKRITYADVQHHFHWQYEMSRNMVSLMVTEGLLEYADDTEKFGVNTKFFKLKPKHTERDPAWVCGMPGH